MKLLPAFLALCLTVLISACVQINQPSETAYSDQINVFVAEVKNKDLVVAEKPNRESDLSEYLTYAIAISPEISALREAELSATSGVSLASSKAQPQVSATSSVGAYSANVTDGTLENGASINLTASQLVYDGGLVSNGISVAQLQVELARVEKENGINRLSGEAASAMVGASLAAKELEAIIDFQEEIKPHSAQLERMAVSGLIDRSIIDEITSKLLEINIKEKEAKSSLTISEVSYSKYFGDLPIPNNVVVFPLSLSSDIVDDLSIDNIPAVRESALRTLLAEKQIAVARSAFMPKINAQIGSSSPMDPDENISAQAGILISYQFSDGGAREANLSRAESDFEQAKRSLEYTFESSGAVIESLQEQIASTKEIIALTIQKLPILTDQLRVAETQIQTGQADISKVFDLKLRKNELESRVRRRQAELVSMQFELAAVLGILSN
ncbi:TolC family protein [Rhodobacteraceae bacterium]|nr:TolC family protein [Paracoccaceae bacterium]